ncbi:MAG: phosphate ABC transporter permease PstA [Pseudomonadota bacterium]
MTDISITAPRKMLTTQEAADRRKQRRAKRFAAESRFKFLGLSAIIVAAAFLVILMSTIVGKSIPAFTQHYLVLPIDKSFIDPSEPENAKYNKEIRKAVGEALPFVKNRKDKKLMRGLVSSGAGTELRKAATADLADFMEEENTPILLSDFADLYAKGLIAANETVSPPAAITVEIEDDEYTIRSGNEVFGDFIRLANKTIDQKVAVIDRRIASLENAVSVRNSELAAAVSESDKQEIASNISSVEAEISQRSAERDKFLALQGDKGAFLPLDETMPSLLVWFGGGVVKASMVSPTAVVGEAIAPLSTKPDHEQGQWHYQQIDAAEENRKFSDKEVAYMEFLQRQDLVESKFSTIFFNNGASREAEMAGIWGAVVGSFYTMVVTLLLSFPLGVAAAIYLEEFAPKNRLTDIIEVNINNLAAVPSIVFGLLGLAIFLNGVNISFFGLFDISIGGGFRRSAAYVGGMVLALMTLPTIIIASRAALKSVPPSIREAAFGVGASHLQATFHHTLPLAIPGILTGTIIGMARALGETAPLLMIGMVAFIVDIPAWFNEPATVLPVQIYMWADLPEQAFQNKNAAAILVLLVFLVLMNAMAVFLRRRFERRW